MSARSRTHNGSGPPKFRPPPPSFAPPTLPNSQKGDDSYSRNSKSKQSNSHPVEKPKTDFLINNIETEVVCVTPAPKILVEETDISEVVNVTIRPKRSDTAKHPGECKKGINSANKQPSSNGTVNHCQAASDKNQDLSEEEDDLVPEIRNRCNDVNEILNRILNNKDEDLHDANITPNPNNDPQPLDPFEDVDNIADLTIEQVRDILKEEEKSNQKLKSELYNQKDDHMKRSNSSISQKEEKKRKEPQINKKSKKEIQLEKMKNFLKDPSKDEDQDIQLDLRLKKTDNEKEQESNDITEIIEGLFISNPSAAKPKLMEQKKILTLMFLGENSPLNKTVTCHHHILKSEEELGPQHFSDITRQIHNEVLKKQNILIVSSFGTNVTSCLVVAYLMKFKNLKIAEAKQQVEEKRPLVNLNPRIVIKIEEWMEKQTKEPNKIEAITSVSQTWLPFLFCVIFSFLVFRALFGCFSSDRTSLFNVINSLLGL